MAPGFQDKIANVSSQFLSVNLLTPVSELNITLTDRKASESCWNFYISGELWITEGKIILYGAAGKTDISVYNEFGSALLA